MGGETIRDDRNSNSGNPSLGSQEDFEHGNDGDRDAPESTFPAMFKQYREKAGLSQNKLAEMAFFDHSYASRLENGTRKPTADAVERFAVALGLGAEDTDMLLWSAGFVGKNALSTMIVRTEPELAEVFQVLQDDSTPEDLKESLRHNLQSMMRLIGRTAVSREVGRPE